MKQLINRLIAAKSTRLFAILLVVAFIANPELLSLVSVLTVIGVDAFLVMVLWQLRGYFDIALMYASKLLALVPNRRAQQAKSRLKTQHDLGASAEEKR